jgi:4,5-dihydroxyphthalate decarboxylase
VVSALLDASIALSENARTRPIIDGRVKPDGLRLLPTVVHPSEMFWRQLHYGDFDISEMSLASLFIAASRGNKDWAAIPVYSMRRFFHTSIMVRRGSNIHVPKDLIGRKVGVPEYQQTSAVWSRGVLEEFFGVPAAKIEWFMERGPDRSHGAATGFSPPVGVRINQIPASTSIGAMLVSGELDATLLYLGQPNLVDRSTASIEDVTQPLFPDAVAEARRFHAETGLYPINHTLVVRRSLIERHGWVALNIYNAFVRASDVVHADAQAVIQPALETGRIESDAARRLAADNPMPYGLAVARPELERVVDYLVSQGLIARRIALEDVFARSTLEL